MIRGIIPRSLHLKYTQPVVDIIQQRYSCRIYRPQSIDSVNRQQLDDYLSTLYQGPYGTQARFKLVAATEYDRQSLRGLGTYGFIHGATGFIIGAVRSGRRDLEDYGYLMEDAILFATDLGLGTCWLGGSFTRSSFSKKIALTAGEELPAVTATGYPLNHSRSLDPVRIPAHSDRRLPFEKLFYDRSFNQPLSVGESGQYTLPLEMVRKAPSASNKQPWRIVLEGDNCHFYMRRTRGYTAGQRFLGFLRIVDLQRVDMGIAMCHFELTALELGLSGHWVDADPGIPLLDELTEYITSWVRTG